MKKQPNSAAATARLFSRILRENGFERAVIKRDYFLTEGFYVHRVGCGNTVAVHYHVKGYQPDSDRARAQSKVAQMRECLFELSYISSHPHSIYIECKHP